MIKIVIMCFAALLVGCSSEMHHHNQDFLMQHPKLLQHEFNYCRHRSLNNPDEIRYCQTVQSAANAFVARLSQQQMAPQKFGAQLLAQEMDAAKLRNKIQMLQKGPDAKINAELTVAKQELQKLENQIKIDLAVIGLNSPE